MGVPDAGGNIEILGGKPDLNVAESMLLIQHTGQLLLPGGRKGQLSGMGQIDKNRGQIFRQPQHGSRCHFLTAQLGEYLVQSLADPVLTACPDVVHQLGVLAVVRDVALRIGGLYLSIIEDAETAHNLVDGEWGQKLAATAESAGFKVLGIGDYGFRQLTTSKKQVNSMADYAGLKIRVMQNNLYIATYSALGADPTPMASGEVFTALQQNVVDGQENPLSNIYTQKFNEVQSYILKDNHVCDFLIFVFSKEFYDGLTADEQTALQAAVDVAVNYTREQCAADDADCEAKMAENLTITEISDEFRQECVDATASVREEYGKEADETLYNEMMEALA